MKNEKKTANFCRLQLQREIPRNYTILDLGMEGDAGLKRFAFQQDFFTFSTTDREATQSTARSRTPARTQVAPPSLPL